MKKPPTDICPFCQELLVHHDDDEFVERWYCDHCRCESDKDMPRYAVTHFKPDKAYLQEFELNSYYVKNNYHDKITKIYNLIGCAIDKEAEMPLVDWYLTDQERCLQLLKLYLTFSWNQ